MTPDESRLEAPHGVEDARDDLDARIEERARDEARRILERITWPPGVSVSVWSRARVARRRRDGTVHVAAVIEIETIEETVQLQTAVQVDP